MAKKFNEDMNKNIIEALQKAQEEDDLDFETEDVLTDDAEETDLSSIADLAEEEVSTVEEVEAPEISDDDFSMLNDMVSEEPAAIEEPVSYEDPVFEAPKEEPVFEPTAPAYEEPVYEAPKYEEPTYEAPAYEAPKYEEPAYEAPKYEEPVYEAPRYESHVEESHSYEQDMAPHAVVEKLADELYQFEIPSNVAVLKKLISQLPSGVTRQTGAQIIKQTMEALGISMKSVLQDAQAVQEKLNNSAKECQATIQEYKRQIATLEEQATSYRKQYNNLNELVSLFIQH